MILYIAAVIFAIAQFGVAHSWVAQENFHNDANPGKCTITPSLVISPGETVKSPYVKCADIRCEDANGLGIIMSCGVAMHPEGCKWGPFVNINSPYPHCCDRYILC